VLRDGSEVDVRLILEARPGQKAPQTEIVQSSGNVWLGILGQAMTSDLAEAMNLDSDQQGVLVQQVEANSPADEAGLRGSFKPIDLNGEQALVGGDVITELNGEAVSSMEELRDGVQQFQPGEKVTLTILRDGEQIEITVTLAERPE
jgi:2-alkenal reductase